MSRETDVVLRDGFVTSFVSTHQWPGKHPNVLVIPNEHYESVFDLPDEIAPHLQRASRRVSMALVEAFGCDGISIRQNNRPAGGQDVFHYHLHVTPRFRGDGGAVTSAGKTFTDSEMRAAYAAKLRRQVDTDGPRIEFQRTLPKKRLAAGLLIHDAQGRVLIVKPTYKDTWEIPGGAVEVDESPRDGSRRESREELGIDIRPQRLLCVDYNSTTDGYLESLMFIFDGGTLTPEQEDAIAVDGREVSEWQFVDTNAAEKLLNRRLGRRIREIQWAHAAGLYLENQQQPVDIPE